MGVFRIMGILIEYPLLALVPAAVLLYLFSVVKAKVILIAGLLWLAYVPYEYGMKLRLLCTGECNIRVDLLLIYTLLIALTLGGLVAFALERQKKA